MTIYINKNDRSSANDGANPIAPAYTVSQRINLYTSLRIDSENSLIYRTKGGDGNGAQGLEPVMNSQLPSRVHNRL